MKYLGIDYGSKHIGIALSDDTGILAFPRVVLENNKDIVFQIMYLCETEKVGAIIIGESKDFAGKENSIMPAVHDLKKSLEERLKIKVHLEPEFMTSLEAKHIQGENAMHDASAAALILKSFLDKKHDSN